jgi:pimeloyl-ACP methyl ester carboxylesterase
MLRWVRRIIVAVVGLVGLGYAVAVTVALLPHEEVPRAALTIDADQLITVEGVTLRYRTFGDRAAPALVLLHGFANSLQTWREFAPLAAATFYVITVDMPGYGLSDKPVEHDYHNDAQGRLIGAFIRALGLQRAIVGGHSLGGAVALHTALTTPEVSGLVLFNPGIISTGVPAATQYLFFPLQRLSARQFAKREFRATFLKQSYLNPAIVTPAVVDEVMLGTRMEGYMDGMAALMDQYVVGEEMPLLDQLDKPTLIVWGNQDRNKPSGEARDLQRRIAGSRLVRIDAAGHYVHEEQPAAAADAVIQARRWLTRDPS